MNDEKRARLLMIDLDCQDEYAFNLRREDALWLISELETSWKSETAVVLMKHCEEMKKLREELNTSHRVLAVIQKEFADQQREIEDYRDSIRGLKAEIETIMLKRVMPLNEKIADYRDALKWYSHEGNFSYAPDRALEVLDKWERKE